MYALWVLVPVVPRSRDFPGTPEEAAEALLAALGPMTRLSLARIRPEDLRSCSRPLGNYCRDVLGLDGRNQELIKACRFSDPDEAVQLVVRIAWTKARVRSES